MKANEYRFKLVRVVLITEDTEELAREKITGEWDEITLEEMTPNQPEVLSHD